ncbi:hypothetical protein [Lactiplantibacillus modestisalitolerans]|uniref:Uncharacterized protein n=1 Tax=Lactiplantibacillus modestisalitolerans TaxID=1457219 RepID=A0ABV5WTS4_9LACO|nr:hypothetical protein [Lactiplantibacillus modestisalitolerans]
MKKVCILVYQGLPFIIDPVVTFNQKENQFVEKLNHKLNEVSMDWHIELDNSSGNIDDIMKKNPQVLILKNGLQQRFYKGNFPQERIYQLDALELNEGAINGVISFLKRLA